MAIVRAGGVLLVAAALLLVALVAQRPSTPAAAQQVLEPPSISVVGQGIVMARPDRARVMLGVEIVDPSLASAQQRAASQMESVITTLLQFGIDRDDIQTIRFSVQPEYDRRGERSVLTGYRVVNVVSVKLPDISRVGEVIDGVVNAGAARVEGISFEVADEAPLKDQAREQAVAHARTKAQQLADLTGVTLGRPLHIEEGDTGGVRPVAAPAARAVSEASTPIEPGELEIRTQVRIVYAIQ